MEGVVGLVTVLDALDPSALDRERVLAAMRDAAVVRGWLDLRDIVLARRLRELADLSPSLPPAEVDIADASHVSRTQAARSVKRADAAALVPAVEDALGDGAVSVDHIDVLERALARLSVEQRVLLAADGARLVAIAARSTPEA
ncbi:MAG TPA: hypothetical protein VGM78_04400, partial [Ilumatobacteraceae bacterium]